MTLTALCQTCWTDDPVSGAAHDCLACQAVVALASKVKIPKKSSIEKRPGWSIDEPFQDALEAEDRRDRFQPVLITSSPDGVAKTGGYKVVVSPKIPEDIEPTQDDLDALEDGIGTRYSERIRIAMELRVPALAGITTEEQRNYKRSLREKSRRLRHPGC